MPERHRGICYTQFCSIRCCLFIVLEYTERALDLSFLKKITIKEEIMLTYIAHNENLDFLSVFKKI